MGALVITKYTNKAQSTYVLVFYSRLCCSYCCFQDLFVVWQIKLEAQFPKRNVMSCTRNFTTGTLNKITIWKQQVITNEAFLVYLWPTSFSKIAFKLNHKLVLSLQYISNNQFAPPSNNQFALKKSFAPPQLSWLITNNYLDGSN